MANFTPTLGDYTELKPFRFWCQKVLPLVYDDSLSYYELLCKVVDYLNKTMEDVDTLHTDVVNLHDAYEQLQKFVNDYFDNLDVQEEINNKLDAMAQDGSLTALIRPLIPDIVADWLDEHITPTTPAIDDTLSVSGAGADAKKTGDAIANQYNSSNTYKVGDYVLYQGTVYRCISNIDTAELWNSNHWTSTKIGNDVSDLKSALIKTTGFYWDRTLSVISGKKWAIQPTGYSYILSVSPESLLKVLNTKATIYLSILKSLSGIDATGTDADFATGYDDTIVIAKDTTRIIEIPSDGHYIHFYANDPGRTDNYYFPDLIEINGYNVLSTLTEEVKNIYEKINDAGSRKNGTPLNTKFRFKQESVTDGYFVKASDGYLEQNADFRVTDYILINGAKVGISRGVAQFAFYDSNKNFIGGVPVTSDSHDYTEYDIPDGATYIRFSLVGENYYQLSNLYCTFSDGVNCPISDWIIVDDTDLGLCPDFHRLRDAISFATNYKNAKVFIKEGTYNLLSEFENEILNSANYQYGLGLGNGIHVFCQPGAVINCLYTGIDVNVVDNLSPFYTLEVGGGFTLENAEIHSSNCRYCIHDEYGGRFVSIRNIYKNCKMYHDDSGTAEVGRLNYYPQCIGGGTGKHSYVDIVGCYFYSKKAESSVTPLVSYHNGYIANAKSCINVSNSFFADHGTFQCSYYGPSTLVSEAIVNNCSLGAEPYVIQEGGGEWPENFNLLTFNNEIRQ